MRTSIRLLQDGLRRLKYLLVNLFIECLLRAFTGKYPFVFISLCIAHSVAVLFIGNYELCTSIRLLQDGLRRLKYLLVNLLIECLLRAFTGIDPLLNPPNHRT